MYIYICIYIYIYIRRKCRTFEHSVTIQQFLKIYENAF